MKGDLTALQKAKLLRYFKLFWTPAFAGVTIQETFYETIKFEGK